VPEKRNDHPPRSNSRRGLALTGVAVAAMLGLSACGGSLDPAPQEAPSSHSVAPQAPPDGPAASAYIYLAAPHEPLAATAERSGLTNFVLAFVLSDHGACSPAWDGRYAVDDPALISEIKTLRAAGGDVAVSSGGASGDFLENACDDAASLADAYGAVLDATGSNHLDVDVEQDIDVDKVVQALALLQQDRGTEVTLTLQVDGAAEGLTDQAMAMLQGAADRDLDVTTANAMVMNFPYTGSWSQAMTTAADTIAGQLRQVWPDLDETAAHKKLGLTFMIGENDSGMITTVADATQVTRYVAAGGAGSVAFWSINRDNGGCAAGGSHNNCSGISQQPYQFGRALVAAL
jgi:chitinase